MLNGIVGAIDAGPWALDVALKATVLLSLAGLAAAVLRRAVPEMRHAVWASAVVGILLMPLAAAAPGWRVLPGWAGVIPKVSVGDPPAVPTAAADVEPLAQVPPSLDRGGGGMARSGNEADSPGAAEVSQAVAADAPRAMRVEDPIKAAMGSTNSPPFRHAISWTAWAAAAWVAGMAAMLLPLAVAMVALHRLRRAARGVDVPAGRQALEGVKGVLGIGGRVELLMSEACRVPMTFGILWPCIVVPAASADWPATRWKMILTHELAHVRRRDVAFMWLGQLARAIYWFHPLAWVAYRQMGIESEKACDDGVIVAGGEPGAYAAVLLEIAEGSRRRSLMKFAVLHMARPSTLETRVRAVLDGRRRRRASLVKLLALVVAAGLASAGIGVLRAAETAADVGYGMPQAATAPVATGTTATTQVVSDPTRPVCKLPNGATLELMAISSTSRGPWWDATGAPLAADWMIEDQESFGGPGAGYSGGWGPAGRGGAAGGSVAATPDRVLIFKLTGMPADEVRARVGGQTRVVSTKSVFGPGEDRQYSALVDDLFALHTFASPQPKATESFRLGVVVEPWKTVADMPVGTSGKADGGEYSVGEAAVYRRPTPGRNRGGRGGRPATASEAAASAPASEPVIGTTVHLTETFDLADTAARYSGLDAGGKLIDADGGAGVEAQIGTLRSVDVAFENHLPADIKAIRLEVRHYHWIDFANVAMYPRGGNLKPTAAAPAESGNPSPEPTSVADAIRRGAPVFRGSDPNGIPQTEQIRTQILPLKNLDAVKLLNDLRPMISQDADVAANVASQSLIITDTASHIHRLALIIQELDVAATAVGKAAPAGGTRSIMDAASDAEADAMLALAKDRADDLSEIKGQQALVDTTQSEVAIEEIKFKGGVAPMEELAAAKSRLAAAQAGLDSAQHRHQQAVLSYNIATAQYDARKVGAQKH